KSRGGPSVIRPAPGRWILPPNRPRRYQIHLVAGLLIAGGRTAGRRRRPRGDFGRWEGTTSLPPTCRLCGADLTHTFVDLGMSPLCESYVPAAQLDQAETSYPLHVRLCPSCLLVQLPAYVSGEHIFSDYAYFSSYSDSWVAHAKRYADEMTARLGLGGDSLVTEVASNDGYLLQHFVAAGIPVLGVEPAANVAETARDKGIRTEVEFLG